MKITEFNWFHGAPDVKPCIVVHGEDSPTTQHILEYFNTPVEADFVALEMGIRQARLCFVYDWGKVSPDEKRAAENRDYRVLWSFLEEQFDRGNVTRVEGFFDNGHWLLERIVEESSKERWGRECRYVERLPKDTEDPFQVKAAIEMKP